MITDGNPGVRKAVREVFPRAHRQRCQVHKMRNLLSKLPRLARAQIKPLIQQVFEAPSHEAATKRHSADAQFR